MQISELRLNGSCCLFYLRNWLSKRIPTRATCCYANMRRLELDASGCSAARSARLPRVQEVLGSNPGTPTKISG